MGFKIEDIVESIDLVRRASHHQVGALAALSVQKALLHQPPRLDVFVGEYPRIVTENDARDASSDAGKLTDVDFVVVILPDCSCGVPDFDCPDLMMFFGEPCDDGDPLTTGEVILPDCSCGVPDFDCPDLLGDIGDPEACNMGEMVQTAQAVLDLLDQAIKSDLLSQLPLIGDLGEEGRSCCPSSSHLANPRRQDGRETL